MGRLIANEMASEKGLHASFHVLYVKSVRTKKNGLQARQCLKAFCPSKPATLREGLLLILSKKASETSSKNPERGSK